MQVVRLKMTWWTFCVPVLLFWVTFVTCQQCQRQQFGSIDGDIILGATFNIHAQAAGAEGCSEKVNADAVQRLEAAHFAVQKLNEDKFLPGVTFGIRSYDDCGRPDVAVHRAVDFLAEREKYADDSGSICPANVMFPGMLSALYSGVTARVAQFLNYIPMPTVSYASHSLELSDTNKFPYFQRLVPSATSAVKVGVTFYKSNF
ncbi:metabotropic glutamate receptor 3 [Lingula anatina]|uniref:Metabotropic glutamate receptor 3 n=1 Tax=Lingula anatina TaxID=7574 RepID=A0A1S3IYN4_LINAN|nr:metabotropic glutamate receptor 3 [Lingula anatina]|eukprot:XP_013403312.1 metabotropic glutamate receptor 3 [Lingula anatina]